MIVAEGAHFRIEPGVVLKMATGGYGYDLNISGSLQAVGTPDSPSPSPASTTTAAATPATPPATAPTPRRPPSGDYIKFEPTRIDVDCTPAAVRVRLRRLRLLAARPTRSSGATRPPRPSATTASTPTTSASGPTATSTPLIQDNYLLQPDLGLPLATRVLAEPQLRGQHLQPERHPRRGADQRDPVGRRHPGEDQPWPAMTLYPYYNLGTTDRGAGHHADHRTGRADQGPRQLATSSTSTAPCRPWALPSDRIIMTSHQGRQPGRRQQRRRRRPLRRRRATGRASISTTPPTTPDSLVENCLFRFARQRLRDRHGLGCSPTIINNEFELCTYGLRMLNDSSPTIQNNLFRVLTWYPIEKSILATPTFGGNILDNVNYPCHRHPAARASART